MTERWITVLQVKNGKRTARRFALHVPLAMARGRYEELSNRALNDLIKDLTHEQRRREGGLFS